MYPLHVVKQVPTARETISRNRAITILERTEMWLLTVAMHTVSFPFMTQETSGR